MEQSLTLLYQHYKYYHFYSVCFGLGWGTAVYSPFHSLAVPSVIAVFFIIAFEVVGLTINLPPHTKRCKGRPYDKGGTKTTWLEVWEKIMDWFCHADIYWGFGFAFFVAWLNLPSNHVYTLSYGSGIIMFALRGVKRKYSSLWKLRKGQRSRR